MKSGDGESSSVTADSSIDSESDLTNVTETQCEISEDLLNSGIAASSTEAPVSDSQSVNEGKTQKLPNMTSPYWYNDKCFSRYWNHYNKVMNWYQKHLYVHRSIDEQYYSNITPHVPRPHRSKRGKRNRQRARNQKKHPKQKINVENVTLKTEPDSVQSDPVTNSNELMGGMECPGVEKVTSETDEYEMEITDDMLQFFAKSQQHRKERDSKGSNSAEHINIEDTHKPVRTVEPPKERPGVRRTAEMKLLYGKGAAMIHGMETALMMTYDRNLDVKQPKVWPNIPLRIVFAD